MLCGTYETQLSLGVLKGPSGLTPSAGPCLAAVKGGRERCFLDCATCADLIGEDSVKPIDRRSDRPEAFGTCARARRLVVAPALLVLLVVVLAARRRLRRRFTFTRRRYTSQWWHVLCLQRGDG